MYNADMPSRAELPSSAKLLRSTVIALATAALLLVTVVMPAEYGLDPTGAGRILGLTQMGEIKRQLHEEAEEDRLRDSAPAGEQRSGLLSTVLAGLVIRPAFAHGAHGEHEDHGRGSVGSASRGLASGAIRSDEVTLTLKPGEGTEFKAEMRKGQRLTYSWKVAGGVVNHDTHGDPANPRSGSEHSYKKGRAVAGDAGVIQAAFDGHHGWFWRNRTDRDVTITLRVDGEYAVLKKVK